MSQLPPIITDLALILAVAGAVSLLFKRFNQPMVLGYIIAGFLTGPGLQLVPSVTSPETVKVWGDVGVIFLMFVIGLEFSMRKIFKMGSSAMVAAVSCMVCMISLGALAGYAFGWSEMDSLFLGGMLAISSSSIQFKAMEDLGYSQKRFAGLVLGVSVLEDILGIVLMVILAGMAQTHTFEGDAAMNSMIRLGFMLTLWFVVGAFLLPLMLRKMRKWMNKETLLIFSLAMCFLMVVVADALGYSAALGAFVMGSILAETVEADAILKVTEPVKNLFGAIFFVSVGMLVNPDILANYWQSILIITAVLVVGQMFFGTGSFMLSGQPPRIAMQCGFSMGQIGEISFIIAAMGVSLGVMSDFLYPVIVAVTVTSTFTTPYIMRMADPTYDFIQPYLPRSLREWTTSRAEQRAEAREGSAPNYWKELLAALFEQTVIYSILTVAVMLLNYGFLLRVSRTLLGHWGGNAFTAIATLVIISFFLRAIVMKKNHSIEWQAIRKRGTWHRLGLHTTFVVRYALCSYFIYYLLEFVSPYQWWLHAIASVVILGLIIASRFVKRGSIRLERVFHQNINSRTAVAQVLGRIKPRYAKQLRSRDVHFGWLQVPAESSWCGQTLATIGLGQEGVLISAIIRNGNRINAPEAHTIIFPEDQLEAIGCDAQLTTIADRLRKEAERPELLVPTRAHQMHLRLLPITADSPFLGKTVANCNIKEDYRCLIVGFETETDRLETPQATRTFEIDDIVWLVGEEEALNQVPGITTANVDDPYSH
ncbi:MAG: cation:proton antiporter [Bacteroidales bacterium]|nr:cation:proton antiporter [Bacteroidales bacterium]